MSPDRTTVASALLPWTRARGAAAALLMVACVERAPAPHDDSDDTEPSDDTLVDTVEERPGDTDGRDDVEVGPALPCADPSRRVDLGPLTAPVVGGDWADQVVTPENASMFTGGGVAAADLDGDGRLDLVRTSEGPLELWLQRDGLTFVDGRDRLPSAVELSVAATPADVDGDGDLDLFVARFGAGDLLWRNDGGTFVDVTEAAGVAGPEDGRSTAGSFADLDRDGDLDLFVGMHAGLAADAGEPSPGSRLYLNRGDGTFDGANERLVGDARKGHTFVGGWHDLDGDGWLDLYLVNDFGRRQPSVLLWNREGTLVQADVAVGLSLQLQGMGLGVGDLDDDGDDDLVIADVKNHAAMLAHDGAWYDAHAALGLVGDVERGQLVGWATELADLDADGDLDVIEGFGKLSGLDMADAQPDEIFLHDGDRFVPVGAAWGFDHPGRTRGVLVADVDRDGWLDLLRGDLTGPATLQLGRCSDASWTMVSVRDVGKNPDGVGARIEVTAGGRTWHRTVVAGSTAVLAGGPPEVHVGLGEATRIERVEVRWPDGGVTVHEDLPVRRRLTVMRPPP